MSDPRAEVVKEALKWWDEQKVRPELKGWLPLNRIVAAARLWLASQEQTPDIEWCETHKSGFNWHNAEERFGPRCDAYRLMSWPNPSSNESDCRRALVGFHPQDEGDDDAVVS